MASTLATNNVLTKVRYKLRFGIRGLFVLTSLAALAFCYYTPYQVVYHSSVATWERKAGKSKLGQDYVNWSVVGRTGFGLKFWIVYSDYNDDGKIDTRYEVCNHEYITTWDLDHDGVFDKERRAGPFRSRIERFFWADPTEVSMKQIHVPVPSTTPPSSNGPRP